MLARRPDSIYFCLLALVLAAAFFDLRSRRIPNWLTLIGTVAGLCINAGLGGVAGLKESGLGLLLAFGLYLLLYLARAVGAGDVKLMAAAGACAGPAGWLVIFVMTAITGGICALVIVLAQKRLRDTLVNVGFIFHEILHFRPPFLSHADLSIHSPRAITLPHAAMIATGSLLFTLLSRRAG